MGRQYKRGFPPGRQVPRRGVRLPVSEASPPLMVSAVTLVAGCSLTSSLPTPFPANPKVLPHQIPPCLLWEGVVGIGDPLS